MDKPTITAYPDRLNAFLTTEHFTLQSARSMVNSEIVSRVNIYFTTLSSILIAAAFLAQMPALSQFFGLFAAIAFPVLVILGLFTFARLIVLGNIDAVYLRAINRVRHFYVQAAPEALPFLLFPPYDDDRSVQSYGGYTLGARGNLLSAAHMVIVTNSIIATVMLSALLSPLLKLTLPSFLPLGLGLLVVIYFAHGLAGVGLARPDRHPEYYEVRFPPPKAGAQ